ncbi:(Na+)-NQR maturation NqrM [Rubinisphaera margarita]|uniref:(Na+)-NQR maturation NqrM n=1 Tax=Rubinisphaera margarita TaxID=2909586 RepID=UPI001EE7F514|nr:(Na+)-NQR maturation NqrM [Rubinisphaera margarita]MCG6155611.1 (Na+)-NQR maturation NqrM [Rubinisphaera margarita]
MATFIASVLVFAAAIIGMAVGVMLSNRCLRGSCGGLSNLPGDAGQSLCESCASTTAVDKEPARAHANH